MNNVSFYTMTAIILAVILSIIIAVRHRRESRTTESRIQRMMMCCGIKEKAALHADHILRLDMKAVRSRCRRCPVTELCDRWLDGEAVAGNGFCPNVWHFKEAA